MDLDLSPKEREFRDEVRAFLDDALTDDMKRDAAKSSFVFSEFSLGKRWHEILHAKGWSAPDWPEEHGGPGWTLMQRYIFATECARADAPSPAAMGVKMVGPVLMKFGTEEQKDYYLPKILSGEHFWCQGYSEPGSGSDLASLQTRAVRDGDHYIVNGQKIWTTYAHHADMIFCLVRTSSDGKPQQGITFLLIDMKTPGITIDPIITLAGEHEVNQVFFDDVRVPVENRVGEENDGWTVAKTLLEFERGGSYAGGLHVTLDRVADIARLERASEGRALIDDPAFKRRLSELRMEIMAVEYTEHRVMSALAAGDNPGAASSMLNAAGTETGQRIHELALEAVHYYAAPEQLDARQPGSNVPVVGPDYALTVMPRYLENRATTIYGGTSEVQRNIMAKMVLGV